MIQPGIAVRGWERFVLPRLVIDEEKLDIMIEESRQLGGGQNWHNRFAVDHHELLDTSESVVFRQYEAREHPPNAWPENEWYDYVSATFR